jgi:hypothetical protein
VRTAVPTEMRRRGHDGMAYMERKLYIFGHLLNIYPTRPLGIGHWSLGTTEDIGWHGSGIHIINLWSGMQSHDCGYLTSNKLISQHFLLCVLEKHSRDRWYFVLRTYRRHSTIA